MASLHLQACDSPAGPPLPPDAAADAHAAHPARRRRQRVRGFAPEPLSVEQLAALLSAGFDVACPPNWGRGAPSSHHWHEVGIYVLTPGAVYSYDAAGHQLTAIDAAATRAPGAGADALATAPVQLVYVVDDDAVEQAHAEEHGFLIDADAGCIVENIYRHCAAAGLATAVHGPANRRQLARMLGLKPSQRIVLAQAVGHPRQPDAAAAAP